MKKIKIILVAVITAVIILAAASVGLVVESGVGSTGHVVGKGRL